uniref:Uncharacterized protein n=1 Tax=Rangifer tarandus platyrhynchus TaxID=3082113 RepID=A0ACB0EMS5_RANTA|nr:unnamed protein product [Rangifer tarandus platyrhynchus]
MHTTTSETLKPVPLAGKWGLDGWPAIGFSAGINEAVPTGGAFEPRVCPSLSARGGSTWLQCSSAGAVAYEAPPRVAHWLPFSLLADRENPNANPAKASSQQDTRTKALSLGQSATFKREARPTRHNFPGLLPRPGCHHTGSGAARTGWSFCSQATYSPAREEAFRWVLTHTCAATGRPSCETCGQCKQTGPGALTVEPPRGLCVPGLEVPPEAAHRPHLCSKASESQGGVRGSATAPPETPASSSRPSALGGLGCRPEFVMKTRLPSSQSTSSLSVLFLRLFLESLVLCPPASPEDTMASRPPPPAQAPPDATTSCPQEPSPQAPVGVDDGARPSWPGGVREQGQEDRVETPGFHPGDMFPTA